MTKKTLFSYLLLLFAIFVIDCPVFGQIYTLNDFSDKYYAKVNLVNLDQDEAKISIYDKSTNTNIISVNSDNHVLDLQLRDYDKIKKQEVVLFLDFNFDNNNDFAIQTGFSSKGPSYEIFLFENGKYSFNKIFTEIIQNSQGDFSLDKKSKSIKTRGNGGCCWHSFSTFVVFNGIPKLMEETILESGNHFQTETISILKNEKYVKKSFRKIDLTYEGIKEVMSFNLKDTNKRLVLYDLNQVSLNYVLIDQNDNVEFYYPKTVEYVEPDFSINSASSELIFLNKGVKYKIYQKMEKDIITQVGILVYTKNKTVDLKGDLKTLKGKLHSDIIGLENVCVIK